MRSSGSPRNTVSGSGRLAGVDTRVSFFAHAAILSSAAVVVFLAAGPPQGSLGIFLALAGLTLLAFPPAVQVSGKLWTAAGALVACSALALLPAGWFPTALWRIQLAHSPIIALAPTVSPSPWETAFWMAIVLVSVCIGLFLLSHPLRSARMISLAAGAALTCSIYAAAAIVAKVSGWKYPFSGSATFGFFPNRNHTAAFLVTGTLLALGVLGVAYRRRHWIAGGIATASMTLCAAGLGIFSESRGGVIFAAIGAALWIIGLGRTHLDRRLVIYAGTFAALVGIGFFFFGGVARDRLLATFHQTPAAHPPSAGAEAADDGPTFDARVVVYQDAIRMARNFPWTGSGLGTFALIFPQYEKAALSDATSIHPESDWLMWADEAGVPAAICAAVALWLLFRNVTGRREHAYWPLRWGCMVAVTAALLHGIVDVPVHRVALGWWILALAGLAFQTERGGRSPRFGAQRAVFLLAGLLAIGLGAELIRAEWFGGKPLAPFVSQIALAKAEKAVEARHYDQAYAAVYEGLQRAPMSALLYYEAGNILLAYDGTEAQVNEAFEAERRLSPNWPGIPRQQAAAWSRVSGEQTAKLWTEVLDRQHRLDLADRSGDAPTLNLYRDLLNETANRPDLQRLLVRERSRGTAYGLLVAESAVPEVARECVAHEVIDEQFLNALNSSERVRFLKTFISRGDHNALMQFLGAHPAWKEFAPATP